MQKVQNEKQILQHTRMKKEKIINNSNIEKFTPAEHKLKYENTLQEKYQTSKLKKKRLQHTAKL